MSQGQAVVPLGMHVQDQHSPDFSFYFSLLRERPQASALLTYDAQSLTRYLAQKLKGRSICLGSRFKGISVYHGKEGSRWLVWAAWNPLLVA